MPAISSGGSLTTQDERKAAAASTAAELVQTGMILGLGTGSTVAFLLDDLAGRIEREGLDVTGVATSEDTARTARALGIPMVSLDDVAKIDLTIDGADEVDPGFAMIKGGGGALLREKIVARASERVAIMVDDSKLVPVLGAFDLPVEIVPFGRRVFETLLETLGVPGALRRQDGETLVTDGGHWIVDCAFGRIEDPAALHARLVGHPAVVETGLFVGLLHTLIVAGADGVEVRDAPHAG